jgi:hypothetical protein
VDDVRVPVEVEEPVAQVVAVVARIVPGAPPHRPLLPGTDPLGDAIDRASPGFATQAADAALRALVLTAWGERMGGMVRLAASRAGQQVLATWAALDVVLPLGDIEVARVLGPHLADQARRFEAVTGVAAPRALAGVALLQERIEAAASCREALRDGVRAVLWTSDGRLAWRPDRLVFYGRLGAQLPR